MGIPALLQKDALESERATLQAKLGATATDLLRQSGQLQQNTRSIRALVELLALPSLAQDLPQVD